MQSNQFQRTRVAAAIAGVVLALGAGQALGAAFALQEQSVSGLGNAYAGGAAAAEDAATVWSNPAGMARFSTIQIVAGLNIITPSIKFNDSGSLHAFNQPLGGTGGNAGSTNYVPNLYLVVPINAQFAFGLGIGAPFGLVTEWDSGWLGRYQAIKSDVKTMNINPALSWRVVPNFSVGVGVDYQQIKATFTSNANYSAALAQGAGQAAAAGLIPPSAVAPFVAATSGLDSNVNINGDDSAWGWNIGALWDITPDTRLGGHFRSSIKYDVSGNIGIDNPTLPPLGSLAPIGAAVSAGVNAQLASGGVTSSIEVPAIANVSIFSHISPKWDVMADAQWTQWSSIPELKFVRTGPGAPLPATPENFKDVWRLSAGASYIMDDHWKFRGGVAWDESPVQNAERTPRLPDASRTWVSVGAQYTMSPNWKFDAGFTYIWANDASSNQNEGSTNSNGLIAGNYKSSVTIFGVQAAYAFSPPPQPVKVAEIAPPPAPVAKPAPPPPPPPAPPPPAPTPQVQKITLDAKVLFDFDKSVLKPEGKAAIDSQVVGNLAKVQKLDVVLVTGHTDRIGTEKYNQGLSERRADAVRDYLVSKGVDKAKIETIGLGEKQPVVQCDQKNFKELIACLQPNRRVEVEVKGEAKK